MCQVLRIPQTDENVPRELFNQWLDVILQVQEQKQWTEPCYNGEDYYPPNPKYIHDNNY